MDQTATGKFIMKKRKELNLTQEQLAQKLGVSNKPSLNGKPENVCPIIPLLNRYAQN